MILGTRVCIFRVKRAFAPHPPAKRHQSQTSAAAWVDLVARSSRPDGALAKSLSHFRAEIDRHAKYALELGVECAHGDVSDVGAKLEMVTALSGLLSDSVGCKTFTKQVPALWSKACSVCLELQPKLLAKISEGTIRPFLESISDADLMDHSQQKLVLDKLVFFSSSRDKGAVLKASFC